VTAALGAIAVGIAIGVVFGALGAGGGILTIPVLVYVLGQDPHAATSASLVVVLFGAATGIVHHACSGHVLWRRGGLFGLASVVGAAIGSTISPLIPAAGLLTAFAALLLGMAVLMARKAARTRHEENEGAVDNAAGGQGGAEAKGSAGIANEDGVEDGAAGVRCGPAGPHTSGAPNCGQSRPSLWALITTATVAGLLTGVFGVGGGFIIVPVLVGLLGIGMRHATATSLWIMVITVVASIATRAIGGSFDLDWTVALLFAVASSIGAAVGGPLSDRARPSTLTAIFAVVLLVVGLYTGGETLLT